MAGGRYSAAASGSAIGHRFEGSSTMADPAAMTGQQPRRRSNQPRTRERDGGAAVGG
ncbi:hypothetical protein QT196_38725 (plasmid) [Streptomyces sp. P9-2B-2]|uniref:hypothetical protein n=1 Tax=Streptomyces sp. P9-2B-2 TaxID=3057114 RepID=UPI0025B5ABCE|nr:hypothetical protein [Streptomyces sp. P9-2B-2]WJY43200.1 hypothetical protein QT196_38725 [Streptomyces sp. P9-2B-2]